MWKFLKSIWFLIVTVATLVGIFYIPVDTIGIDEASGPWRKVIAMIDQNTALWIFGIGTTIYIGWIDVRPTVRKWIEGRDANVAQSYAHSPLESAYSNEIAMRLFRLADRIVALESNAHEFNRDDFRKELLGLHADRDMFCAKGTAAEKWQHFQSSATLVNSAVNGPELGIDVTPSELTARVRRDQRLKIILRRATSDLIEELMPIS